MQDRPACAISPSRFPFPVFTPLIKPSSGRCVEPTTVHPYLYRDAGILHNAPKPNLDREAYREAYREVLQEPISRSRSGDG